MTHKFFYLNDFITSDVMSGSVVIIKTNKNDATANLWYKDVRQYKRPSSAAAYLKSIAEGNIKLNEKPDDVGVPEPDETPEEFEDRLVGESEHVAEFERIYPENPLNTLTEPKSYFKDWHIFSGEYIWYTSEKEAKKDADNTSLVYVGEVEVYDPKEIERLDQIIASYPTA